MVRVPRTEQQDPIVRVEHNDPHRVALLDGSAVIGQPRRPAHRRHSPPPPHRPPTPPPRRPPPQLGDVTAGPRHRFDITACDGVPTEGPGTLTSEEARHPS